MREVKVQDMIVVSFSSWFLELEFVYHPSHSHDQISVLPWS